MNQNKPNVFWQIGTDMKYIRRNDTLRKYVLTRVQKRGVKITIPQKGTPSVDPYQISP